MRVVMQMTGRDGTTAIKVGTTTTNQAGAALKIKPGVGEPFYAFASVPTAWVAPGATLMTAWDGAIIVDNDPAVTNAAIAAMLDSPPDIDGEDAVIWVA